MRLDSPPMVVLSAFAAGLIAIAPASLAREAPAHTRAQGKRPLIVQSVIAAPRSIGAFRLKETSYRPEQKAAGAMFRYAAVPEPELNADVFVYPAGRAPQAEAIKRGMDDFRASLQAAQQAGYFRNLKLLGEESFALAATPAAKSDNPLEAVLTAVEPVGRRIEMSFDAGEASTPFRSRGYLFNKQLYFYKVRVSVPAAAMTAAAFDQFADHAARTLVERIDTLNIGGCVDDPVYVDSNADTNAAALALVTQVAQRNQENCRSKIGEADLAKFTRGAETVTIDYAPGDWGGP